ncbi:MAG TPA: HEAT repeat domain-containing protein [Spirochaetota bacterium]|nr:HEAT repeat domain-containing protein [Spirochaetota bacterium]HOL57519.1 HEAT repeat domain-containing protein [Spirochaetota bacterium]HPP05002.1 HEAT repeat domain-containing protein [Spirochaetota bacterium]
MTRDIIKTVICFSLFFLPLFVFSETPEELLLQRKEQKIKTYIYQAKSGERDQKIDVLDKILSEFDEMKYSEKDKKLVELIVYLSEEGSTRKEYENNRVINDFPDVRRKAVKVLAKIKGDAARDALINVLINDEDSLVKAEACLALAEVGDSSSGDALRALVYVYRRTYKPDPNFVMAIIQAVQKIAKSNYSSYGDAIYILSEIQMGNYNRQIREAAYNALQELGKK